MLANGVGVVDPFYSDELKIQLLNFTDQPVEVIKARRSPRVSLSDVSPWNGDEVGTMGADGHGGYKTDI